MHLVTQARRPMSEDIKYRQKRYLIMMGIRVVGLVLAVFLFHGMARFIAAAIAIVMPYFAVVFANGGREPDSGRRFQPYDPERRELPESFPGQESPGQDPSSGQYSSSRQYSSSGEDFPSGQDFLSGREDQRGGTSTQGEQGPQDPRDDADGQPVREDSLSDGEGSLSAGEAAADPASQRRTRSNRA